MEEKDNNTEFVPEYFTWMTMEEQKNKVKKLEKITKNEEKIKNNEKNN